MKITLEKAMEALSEFMGEQVDTIHDPVKRSVGLFVVGALRKNPAVFCFRPGERKVYSNIIIFPSSHSNLKNDGFHFFQCFVP